MPNDAALTTPRKSLNFQGQDSRLSNSVSKVSKFRFDIVEFDESGICILTLPAPHFVVLTIKTIEIGRNRQLEPPFN